MQAYVYHLPELLNRNVILSMQASIIYQLLSRNASLSIIYHGY